MHGSILVKILALRGFETPPKGRLKTQGLGHRAQGKNNKRELFLSLRLMPETSFIRKAIEI
jgi:hypothetical protein